ncbi:MAG TPA: 4-hydroxythreonine-4-phosphate dehydrogenase PdxA [Alphaproteobacteria bacterium]|nr:4-hydroxythreonine-4-phosphate dehydrogenase PdxA [Alphaproteobacteria bacterium]
MERDESVRIALAIGDAAGISPELTAKLLAQPDTIPMANIVVVGDARVLADGARVAGVSLPSFVELKPGERLRFQPGRASLLDLGHLDPAAVKPGTATAAGGGFAMRNFRTALELVRAGEVDAVCFTPFNKAALKLAGNPYDDELHFAADVLGHHGPSSEFNVLDKLWNARVTSHVPLNKVSELLTIDSIVGALALTDECLRATGLPRPRIAVAALNPHAGDGGNFGREEIDVIAPAVAVARSRRIAADGPFPADTVFLRAKNGAYDAVMTMYHDQGQIAMKLMGFERGVTVLGGLPAPITTPAHGTAYDIAGKGVADVEATRQAFRLACKMGAARRSARAPLAQTITN